MTQAYRKKLIEVSIPLNAMFSIMDFFPTLASVCGGKMPTDRPIDGVDQSDVLFGKSEAGHRESLFEAINAASAREKSIRHGHPSTLHLWWARRPLAACRAVLFAQLVDDPSAWPERFKTEEAQEVERRRLHQIIRDIVP